MAVAHALKADGSGGAGIGTHDHLYSLFIEGVYEAAARGEEGLFLFATLDYYKRCVPAHGRGTPAAAAADAAVLTRELEAFAATKCKRTCLHCVVMNGHEILVRARARGAAGRDRGEGRRAGWGRVD